VLLSLLRWRPLSRGLLGTVWWLLLAVLPTPLLWLLISWPLLSRLTLLMVVSLLGLSLTALGPRLELCPAVVALQRIVVQLGATVRTVLHAQISRPLRVKTTTVVPQRQCRTGGFGTVLPQVCYVTTNR
jgi:hypothetical protein